MGTSFSVVYAVIFMIWLGTSIINDENSSRSSGNALDYISGLLKTSCSSGTALLLYCVSFNTRWLIIVAIHDEAISFDWSGYESQQYAENPVVVTAKRHQQAISSIWK